MNTLAIYKNKVISDIKSIIRLTLNIGLYYSGVIWLYRYINRKANGSKGIKILAYHDIADKSYLNLQVPEKIFESHIKYLIENNYNLISLEEAVNLLNDNDSLPEDAVVITFDDGYKSIYTTVFPIVKQYGIPITVFLTIGPVENGSPLFVDALAYAIKNTSMKELDLTSWNLKKYSIKSPLLREKASYEINEYSKNLSTKIRKSLLEFIFKKLDVDSNTPELRNKMLSWDEVIEMNEKGIFFGAHTIAHPVLSRIPIDEARSEIIGSKMKIEEKLKKKIKTFAYPYGSKKDINEEVRDIVAQSGFSCACVLQDGINKNGDDLFLLKRNCITNQLKPKLLWFFSTAVFAVEMSGIFDLLS